MLNPKKLAAQAKKVRDEVAKAEKNKVKKEALEAEEKRNAELIRQKKELPLFIEEKIQEAAAKGENSYIFGFGSNGYSQEIFDYLTQRFKAFKPTYESIKRWEIENYEYGTGHDYWESAIKFNW